MGGAAKGKKEKKPEKRAILKKIFETKCSQDFSENGVFEVWNFEK